MARYDDDEDFDQDDSGQNDNIPEIRKALRKANARVKELETENSGYRQERSKQSLSKYVSEKGLPSWAARLMQAEGVDPTDESALDKWVFDNKADLPEPTETPESTVEDANDNPFARMSNTQAQGNRGGFNQDQLARINATKSSAELQELLASM